MAEDVSKSIDSTFGATLRGVLAAVAFGCVALVAGEAGARFDDWLFDDVPFFQNPSYEALFYRDEARIRHGRPGMRWKKVRLNNLGMRGEDVSLEPRPGCQRLMFLGASETFGEPSVANLEYPAQVGAKARAEDKAATNAAACVEILNPSFPGIAPQSLNAYYVALLQQFAPTTVYVYPSTHFYLSERLPRKPADAIRPVSADFEAIPPYQDDRSLLDKSRLAERLRASAETPAFIQRRQDRKQIEELLAAEPDGSLFEGVPAERLDNLAADLVTLVESIRASGAEPVLLTHAARASNPPREADLRDLAGMRVYVPRAREDVLAAFEYAAAERTRQVAEATHTRLIDVAAELSGKRELFIDLVHFNTKGHERVAELIVAERDGKSRASAPIAGGSGAGSK